MKAITLYQPWASLLVFGAKQYETRSWKTAYRGPLAIHSGRKFTDDMANICMMEPFASILAKHGVRKPSDLPKGHIVGAVNLEDCISTDDFTPDPLEERLGDFRGGRYAWKLSSPRRLELPIFWQGKLGLFDVPDDVFASLPPFVAA